MGRATLTVSIGGLLALILAGCAAPAPTADALVVVARAADSPDHYDVHLFAWEKGVLAPRWTHRIGPASAAPRALALDRSEDAVIVELRDHPDGRAGLQRVGGGYAPSSADTGEQVPIPIPAFNGRDAPASVSFDTVLDAGGSTLLLARQVQRPARPVLRVSRGEIRDIHPPWAHLIAVDVQTLAARDALAQPAVPLVRLAPLEWLVLVQGPPQVLQVLDARSGAHTDVAAWDAQQHIANAAVMPGGQHALLAVQRRGERWNLFDLLRWERRTNKLDPLIAGVFSANRPNANVGPTLPLHAINDRHFAFVLTEVSEWRGKLPVEGQYHTAIADIQTGNVLVRIRNRERSLRNEVPPPYLPAARLAALRIDRTGTAATSVAFGDEGEAGDERWLSFFSFRNGRLVDAAGVGHDPQTLGPYAYSSDGVVLAVRERSAAVDRCLLFAGKRRLPPIALRNIERLTWLRPTPSGSAADEPPR